MELLRSLPQEVLFNSSLPCARGGVSAADGGVAHPLHKYPLNSPKIHKKSPSPLQDRDEGRNFLRGTTHNRFKESPQRYLYILQL